VSIEIENVSFHYGARQALAGVSVSLQEKGFNALLGPNGAGKSTLFALITRLLSLQEGDIRIGGESMRRHPAQAMRRLGVVFQQSTLDLDLTVAQNLHYHAALHGLSRAHAGKRIHEELDRLNMAERAGEKVRKLNGGHRRRVEIARGLLHQPDILLLDEPTVGLDPKARQDLNDYVHGLCRDQGLTVLWATHLIDEVGPDDPAIIIHQGRVLAHAPSRDICTRQGTDDLVTAFEKLTGDLGVAAL
jgi:ABC-2 type transport system ATP-binding protein